MAQASASGGDDGIVGINVTPLVDIILVILIIFMVSAELVKAQGIAVEKPSAATGAGVESSLEITLTTEETLYIDGAPVADRDAAAGAIRARLADDPSVKAMITADTRIPYGQVVEVIDLARAAGVRDFAIAVEQRTD